MLCIWVAIIAVEAFFFFALVLALHFHLDEADHSNSSLCRDSGALTLAEAQVRGWPQRQFEDSQGGSEVPSSLHNPIYSIPRSAAEQGAEVRCCAQARPSRIEGMKS